MFAFDQHADVVVCWHIGCPTASEAQQEVDAIRAIADEQGTAALIVVIQDAKSAPTAATRATYNQASQGASRVSAVGLVILQRGLVGKAIRVIAKAILSVIGASKPVKMFSSVSQAAKWVAARSNASSRDLERIAGEVQARLPEEDPSRL